MRRDVDGAKLGDMIGRVIGLVLAGGDAAAGDLGVGLEHRLRRAALGGSVRGRAHAGYRQPMPGLQYGVAHIGKLGLPAGSLSVKASVVVGRARVRVVLALLAVEIGAAIGIA